VSWFSLQILKLGGYWNENLPIVFSYVFQFDISAEEVDSDLIGVDSGLEVGAGIELIGGEIATDPLDPRNDIYTKYPPTAAAINTTIKIGANPCCFTTFSILR